MCLDPLRECSEEEDIKNPPKKRAGRWCGGRGAGAPPQNVENEHLM